MSEILTEPKSVFRSIRIALAISGAIALIAGIVLLVWPGKTLVLVTGIIASYLIVAGIVYVGLGAFSGNKGGLSRAGHIVLGLLYIAAGVIGFLNLQQTAATLALITVIFIGISWIVDGVVSLTLLHRDGSRAWTIIYAIFSIVAGAIVIFSPLLAAIALWWILGVTLIVLGVIQIVRAIMLGRDDKVVTQATAATTPAVDAPAPEATEQ